MITAILLGAGQRGSDIYGTYALNHPENIRFVGVADPNKVRRETFAALHGIPSEQVFDSWEAILSLPKFADAAFICTQDSMHALPGFAAMDLGYHILMEKPISPNSEECVKLQAYAAQRDLIFSVSYVLRFSKFFCGIKEVIDSGRLGTVVNIKHSDNIGYWHHAHSYVRGNWAKKATTSPVVLANACHDVDIILWLMGQRCKSVSSFGSLQHFTSDHRPSGAPLRCTDGCPAADSCAFNAETYYLGDYVGWPVSTISEDLSLEGRRRALEEGPYGRCVYACDNDVVDNQVVAMNFENGSTASLTLSAFTPDCNRSIEVMGTKGYLRAEMLRVGENDGEDINALHIYDFAEKRWTTIPFSDAGYMTGAEDADAMLTQCFTQEVEQHNRNGRTSVDYAVESHLVCLAAEESRVSGRIVQL